MPGNLIKASVENPWHGAFAGFLEQVQYDVVKHQRDIITKLTDKILARTPVWMGDTVANWRWSIGAPDETVMPSPASGPPGETNSMPLGVEPRRAASEAVARRSMAAVLRINTPEVLYLTNAIDSVMGIEYGFLPSAERSRVDGSKGVVRLAIEEVENGI